MIVCHCCVIRDTDIKKSVEAGAKSIKDIQCVCDACTDCRGCAKAIREIIKMHRKEIENETK